MEIACLCYFRVAWFFGSLSELPHKTSIQQTVYAVVHAITHALNMQMILIIFEWVVEQ